MKLEVSATIQDSKWSVHKNVKNHKLIHKTLIRMGFASIILIFLIYLCLVTLFKYLLKRKREIEKIMKPKQCSFFFHIVKYLQDKTTSKKSLEMPELSSLSSYPFPVSSRRATTAVIASSRRRERRRLLFFRGTGDKMARHSDSFNLIIKG